MNAANETAAALIDSILAQIAVGVVAHEAKVAARKTANAIAAEAAKARVAALRANWEPRC